MVLWPKSGTTWLLQDRVHGMWWAFAEGWTSNLSVASQTRTSSRSTGILKTQGQLHWKNSVQAHHIINLVWHVMIRLLCWCLLAEWSHCMCNELPIDKLDLVICTIIVVFMSSSKLVAVLCVLLCELLPEQILAWKSRYHTQTRTRVIVRTAKISLFRKYVMTVHPGEGFCVCT